MTNTTPHTTPHSSEGLGQVTTETSAKVTPKMGVGTARKVREPPLPRRNINAFVFHCLSPFGGQEKRQAATCLLLARNIAGLSGSLALAVAEIPAEPRTNRKQRREKASHSGKSMNVDEAVDAVRHKFPKDRPVLHLAQPGRQRSRVEPNACADPEARDATRLCQLKNGNSRHGQIRGHFNSGESVSDSLDLIW